MGCFLVFLAAVLFIAWEIWTGGVGIKETAFFVVAALLFGWITGIIPRRKSGPDTPFICPLNGKECNETCAWYDGEGDVPCRAAKGGYWAARGQKEEEDWDEDENWEEEEKPKRRPKRRRRETIIDPTETRIPDDAFVDPSKTPVDGAFITVTKINRKARR